MTLQEQALQKYPDTLAIYEVSSRALPEIKRKAFIAGYYDAVEPTIQAYQQSQEFVELLREAFDAGQAYGVEYDLWNRDESHLSLDEIDRQFGFEQWLASRGKGGERDI